MLVSESNKNRKYSYFAHTTEFQFLYIQNDHMYTIENYFYIMCLLCIPNSHLLIHQILYKIFFIRFLFIRTFPYKNYFIFILIFFLFSIQTSPFDLYLQLNQIFFIIFIIFLNRPNDIQFCIFVPHTLYNTNSLDDLNEQV